MRSFGLAVVLAAFVGVGVVSAQSSEADTAAVRAVVDNFHSAITGGNPAAAAETLADDAIMLEAGGLETRDEYVKGHLPADIEFEKGVSTKRSPIRVVVSGDTAWATSTSEVMGTYQGRAVNFVGAESMVLTRLKTGWRIRLIHWSSRQIPPAKK
jgi:ketosteroid isomerase-like protein